MPVRSVLVVAKKTELELYTRDKPDPNLLRLIAGDDPRVAHIRRSHDETQRAIEVVGAALAARRIRYQTVNATNRRIVKPHDFIVSVGGDGTLLDASHGMTTQRVLAVNSFPTDSVGYFCGANVDNFAERLDAILSREAQPTPLNRIAVTIGERRLHYAALNDILFAHRVPAATSRYGIRVHDEEESHVSSGVWVSTAAGSTSAIRAAGGTRQPIRSLDLQYHVRELYRGAGSDLQLFGGIISNGDAIELVSRMYEGSVFMDGHRVRFKVGYGDVVRVCSHDTPLNIYLFDRHKRPPVR